jgi:hypothetical protein
VTRWAYGLVIGRASTVASHPVDKKGAHLAMIRVIIRRMALGALLLKGWSFLIVAALLAVAANPVRARFAWLGLFMAITFWVIDAHLLRQEVLFQRLYERVRELPEARLDFSLDTAPVDGEDAAWRSVFFAQRLLLFHGAIVAGIAVFRLFAHRL